MNKLELTESQVKELEKALLELPGKFCIPIITLLNKFSNENNIDNAKKTSKKD